MARIGFTKYKGSYLYKKSVEHKHVPGCAYDLNHPTVKLINMIGGGFFNEPKYYNTNLKPSDPLLSRESNTISDHIFDELGLTEQAREVLETAALVAESETPEDLLIVAAWARDPKEGLKLRSTPQVLLALAAAHPNTKKYVRKYCPSIILRGDEPAQVVAAYIHLFMGACSGRRVGVLPASLRKGISDVLSRMSLYSILKYNNTNIRPNLTDVLRLVDRKEGRPFPKSVVDYLLSKKVTQDSPKIIQARDHFFKLTSIKEATEDLIKTAGLTWENIISHFGRSKESWELAVPLMGEMAITRNLRNFEDAGISSASWSKIYNRLKNTNTKQLPFRFFSAIKNTRTTESKMAAAMQLDRSCYNLPDIDGVTCVLVDNSGSACCASISKKSNTKVSDTGNTLAAVAAKKFGTKTLVGVFGDSAIWVPFNPMDSAVTIKEKITSVAKKENREKNKALAFPRYKKGLGVGQSTETGLWFAVHDLIQRNVHVDRFILLSDLCCYTQSDINCGVDMKKQFGKNSSMQGMFEKYRGKVNAKALVYSVNLAGYGQSQMSPKDKKTHIMSGWSEQIFRMIHDIEKASKTKKSGEVATINYLQSKYKL